MEIEVLTILAPRRMVRGFLFGETQMDDFDYEEHLYGSAQYANEQMLRRAGLYNYGNGLYVGKDRFGRDLVSSGQSGTLISAGARSGKNSILVPMLVDGHCKDNVLCVDPKLQLSFISALQCSPPRKIINFAPRGSFHMPAHRINPCAPLQRGSPTLVADAKLMAQSMVSLDGSANGKFFQETAQIFDEAISIELAERDGVVTLPAKADLVAQFGSLSDDWLAFEERMSRSRFPSVRSVALELQQVRRSNNPNAGGFQGAKAELQRGYAFMSDPQIRAQVSPPFDFCFSQLVTDTDNRYLVNILESHEFFHTSAPIIKALCTCAMIYKRRAPEAPNQVWLLEEIGNVGAWKIGIDLATIGAGFGCRPIYVTQSLQQLDNLGENAASIIQNSCGTQLFMGIRSVDEAKIVSEMLGEKTVHHEDFIVNEHARIEQKRAMLHMIREGGDPFEAAIEFAHNKRLASHKSKTQRPLQTVSELINRPDGQALLFMPSKLAAPAEVRIPYYWQRRDLAGRFLGDRFHSPKGKVEVRTAFGQRFKRIITEAVPPRYADLPQYQPSGTWQYVEGYHPLKLKRR